MTLHRRHVQAHLVLRLLLRHLIHATLVHLREILELLLIVQAAILRLHGRLLDHVLLKLVHLELILLVHHRLRVGHVLISVALIV